MDAKSFTTAETFLAIGIGLKPFHALAIERAGGNYEN